MFNSIKTGVLRVIGVDVKVMLVDEIDKGAAVGESDAMAHVIKIDSKASKQAQEEILMHEALHQIADICGLDWLTEKRITQLSPLLRGVLKDNSRRVKK